MFRPSEDCHSTSHNYADSHTSQRIQDGGPASAVLGSGNFGCIALGKYDNTEKKLVIILILLHSSDPPLTPYVVGSVQATGLSQLRRLKVLHFVRMWTFCVRKPRGEASNFSPIR